MGEVESFQGTVDGGGVFFEGQSSEGDDEFDIEIEGQGRALGDVGEFGGSLGGGEGIQWGLVDLDGASVGGREAGQEAEEGGFSGSVWADDGGDGGGFDGAIHSIEDQWAFGVVEGDVGRRERHAR